MIFVALAVGLATATGVLCERRFDWARAASRSALALMLYALLPFIAFVNFAHLQLTIAAGAGLALAYVGLACAGVAAWLFGRHVLKLPPASLGALICTVIVVNTGYLGLPMTSALLGARHLAAAVSYDQIVTSPMMFIGAFGVGAAFGSGGGSGVRERARIFLTRNPPLIGVLAGLIAPASLVPESLLSASHTLVIALLPVGFFTVGVNLAAEGRDAAASLVALPDRRVALGACLRFGVTPLLLGAVSAFGVGIPTAYLLQSAMPTGINSLIVGHAYGLDQRLIATAIVWSTTLVLCVGLAVAVV